MSDWKVIKTQIEIFPHPTADRLQIGKVGSYQVVVRTGQYKGGESIVFVPEKSILSGPALEFYREYLKGPESNRVGQIRLRGELSGGIIMPPELVRAQCGVDIDDLPCDQDLSELMHITKYVPPIPIEMAGVAVPIEYDHNSIKHDVEQHNTYAHNFVTGERVVITEKLHGSQLVAYLGSDDSGHTHRWVSTKNYNKQGAVSCRDRYKFLLASHYGRGTLGIDVRSYVRDVGQDRAGLRRGASVSVAQIRHVCANSSRVRCGSGRDHGTVRSSDKMGGYMGSYPL